jgi:hypothetical protein
VSRRLAKILEVGGPDAYFADPKVVTGDSDDDAPETKPWSKKKTIIVGLVAFAIGVWAFSDYGPTFSIRRVR